MSNKKKNDDLVEIFTPVIRLRNGKVLYASNYGLKAFRFWGKPRK